jgi:superfamily II DNA or RNA helicase
MDFVIGLLPSLALEDGSRYDQRLYQAFRTVVCDEVHRMGAATFAAVIANFSAAYRVGLSATLDRADGANAVFFDQIGPVVYTATSRSMTPKLRVLTSRAVLRDIRRGRYAVDKDQLNSAQVITQLAEDAGRQRLIVDQILRAIKVGRKILVMSERLEQLRAMWLQVRAAVPALGVPWAVEHGFCTGQWFAAERGKKMRNVTDAEFARAQSAQVIWASKQLIEEGYTNPALDVFVLGTPVGNVEQAASRARGFCTPTPGQCERLCPWRAGRCAGKEDTVIVDVIDPEVPSVQSKWRKRQRLYREMGVKVGA